MNDNTQEAFTELLTALKDWRDECNTKAEKWGERALQARAAGSKGWVEEEAHLMKAEYRKTAQRLDMYILASEAKVERGY